MKKASFDWDDGNRAKCTKHGVSIPEIEALFSGLLLVLPDLEHSISERRYNAIGRTEAGRYVFVVFTRRRRLRSTLMRPISARYMHAKEVAFHAQALEALSRIHDR